MELNLARTEYYMEYKDTIAKAMLTCSNNKGEVYIFLNDDMAYYYLVDDFTMLSMDDIELSMSVIRHMLEDKSRWIKDLSIVGDHLSEFKFTNKVAVYKGIVGSLEFYLHMSSRTNEDGTSNFHIVTSTPASKDVFEFDINAKNFDELLVKLSYYAEAVAIVASEFTTRKDEIMSSTFAQYKKE